jgi:predicted transcriptional regulator
MDLNRVDEIKYRMLVARVKQKDIAVSLGISLQAVNQVVKGQRSTPRIREAISAAIDCPVSDLWPDAP